MAKVAVPVSCLSWDPADAFPNGVQEIFQGEGAWNPVENFTFTGRISLLKDGLAGQELVTVDEKRSKIREKLGKVVPDPERLATLIAFLDENDWDVSFFVDTW